MKRNAQHLYNIVDSDQKEHLLKIINPLYDWHQNILVSYLFML